MGQNCWLHTPCPSEPLGSSRSEWLGGHGREEVGFSAATHIHSPELTETGWGLRLLKIPETQHLRGLLPLSSNSSVPFSLSLKLDLLLFVCLFSSFPPLLYL